jgi:hypothetical protein
MLSFWHHWCCCTWLQTRSHLYKTDGALVGTYQRIDIPILRQFDQYNYVLFTGACLCLTVTISVERRVHIDCQYYQCSMLLITWSP